MTRKKQLASLIFFGIPAFLIIWIAFSVHKQRSFNKNPRPPIFKQQDLALFDKWSKLTWVSISKDKVFRDEIDSISIMSSNNIALDQDHITRLHQSIYQMLVAYHDGSYDDYIAFRMPTTNGVFDEAIIEAYRQMVTEHKIKELMDQKDPAKLFEGIWNYMDRLSTNGQDVFCTRCLAMKGLMTFPSLTRKSATAQPRNSAGNLSFATRPDSRPAFSITEHPSRFSAQLDVTGGFPFSNPAKPARGIIDLLGRPSNP
jgi:hypothetical protein